MEKQHQQSIDFDYVGMTMAAVANMVDADQQLLGRYAEWNKKYPILSEAAPIAINTINNNAPIDQPQNTILLFKDGRELIIEMAPREIAMVTYMITGNDDLGKWAEYLSPQMRHFWDIYHNKQKQIISTQ